MRDLIEKAIGELTEARRYVRSNPRATGTHASKARFLIDDIGDNLPLRGGGGRIQTLGENIAKGLYFLAADPEVLSGYLYGAAFELRNLQMTEHPE